MINSLLIFVVLLAFLVGTHADLAGKLLPADDVDLWFLRLTLNLIGYGTIIVPGYLFIQYYRKIRYDEPKKRKYRLCMTRSNFLYAGNKLV